MPDQWNQVAVIIMKATPIPNIIITDTMMGARQKCKVIITKINTNGNIILTVTDGIMVTVIVVIMVIIIATIMVGVTIMVITIITTMAVAIIIVTAPIQNIITMDTMMVVEQKRKAIITKINTNGNMILTVTAGIMATVTVAIIDR